MSLSDAPEDRLLVNYLLGSLDEEQTERLDELSVANEDVAKRLLAIENDLVDAYVRGQLSGDTLDRFRTQYLVSATAREKVRFAEALHQYQQAGEALPGRGRRRGIDMRRVPAWTLAAAATVAFAAAAYLLADDIRLRRQMNSTRTALETRSSALERQLHDERSARSEMARELARVRESARTPGSGAATGESARNPIIATFLLPAPTRSAGELRTVTFSRDIDLIALRLELDTDEFPSYVAILKDAKEETVLWRSGPLKSAASGGQGGISVGLRANVLKTGNYVIEVTGVSAVGHRELLGAYTFRVVVR